MLSLLWIGGSEVYWMGWILGLCTIRNSFADWLWSGVLMGCVRGLQVMQSLHWDLVEKHRRCQQDRNPVIVLRDSLDGHQIQKILS